MARLGEVDPTLYEPTEGGEKIKVWSIDGYNGTEAFIRKIDDELYVEFLGDANETPHGFNEISLKGCCVPLKVIRAFCDIDKM